MKKANLTALMILVLVPSVVRAAPVGHPWNIEQLSEAEFMYHNCRHSVIDSGEKVVNIGVGPLHPTVCGPTPNPAEMITLESFPPDMLIRYACYGPCEIWRPTAQPAPKAYVGPRLCLQTYDGEHFVSVDPTNNQILRSEATSCGVYERMDFWVSSTSDPSNPDWSDGKPVPVQALVRIQNATGAYLVRNEVGGLQGNNPTGVPERVMFRVNRVEVGPGFNATPGFLKAGDVITLKSEKSGQYVVAEQGGGEQVNANRDQAVTWERFKLVDPN